MNRITNFFSSRWGIIGTGLFIGVVAALLQKLGNPGNMGVCVACFERDIAGSIGLTPCRSGAVHAPRDYRLCHRGLDCGLSF